MESMQIVKKQSSKMQPRTGSTKKWVAATSSVVPSQCRASKKVSKRQFELSWISWNKREKVGPATRKRRMQETIVAAK